MILLGNVKSALKVDTWLGYTNRDSSLLLFMLQRPRSTCLSWGASSARKVPALQTGDTSESQNPLLKSWVQ